MYRLAMFDQGGRRDFLLTRSTYRPTYVINHCFESWTTNYLGQSSYLGQGVQPIRVAYN
jgi:hypothetical protein